MVVLICGDRRWTDESIIIRELSQLPEDTVIVHGNCRGADNMSDAIAKRMGFTVKRFPANWDMYGRAAGPIRNRKMFDTSQPDLVIVFHKNVSGSKGTLDMVTYANAKGCKIKVVTE